MGYDITVQFKKKDEAKSMLHFIESRKGDFQSINETAKLVLQQPGLGSEMGYAPDNIDGEKLVGFHGVGIPPEVWAVCVWMAVRSGVRNKNGDAFLFYDDEPIPIKIVSELPATPNNDFLYATSSGAWLRRKDPSHVMGFIRRMAEDMGKVNEVLVGWSNMDEAPQTSDKKRIKL